MATNGSPRRGDGGKVRYAVVGLGWISQVAQLPGFENAEGNSRLVALVSDDDEKLKAVSKQYGVERTYKYDQYDDMLRSGEVDAVYIGLPNHLHREYTVRALDAGVNVLCEKPMATSEAECRDMIAASERGGAKLMIAYRLHFEPANLKAVEIATDGTIGEARAFNATFTQLVEPGNIRVRKETGGGTVWDIGIYCVNAARYLFRAEPTEVLAVAAGTRGEVEDMASVILRFPGDRLAQFLCGFGEAKVSGYRVVGTKGDLRVEPGFAMTGELKHHLTVGEKSSESRYKPRDQFGPLLEYFSDCVADGKDPEPDGYEGLADVRIIAAAYESMKAGGRPVPLSPIDRPKRPTRDQEIKKSAVSPPELVKARSPGGES